jgi:peptidoglycan DL-endopeptidase CwlO
MEQSNKLLLINEQLLRINQAIQDNQRTIKKTENDIETVYSDIKQLEQEITVLEEKMIKRDKVLKERALSYQGTGGNLSYLEVLLGSADFSEFIDRAGTVAKIVQADHDLFEQQMAEKKDYDFKHQSLESKLAKLTSLKTEYEGMQSQTFEQQKQYENLKEQIEAQNQEQEQAQTTAAAPTSVSAPDKNQGSIAKLLQTSSKYIGHSAYVFGGGRTGSDIQNGRFDCSGFVHWALSQVGIDVGTSTDSIKNSGKQVSEKDLQPGDLVFFDTYKRDGHVGIYIGNGQFIGSQSSTGVAIADMTTGYWKEKFNGRVICL